MLVLTRKKNERVVLRVAGCEECGNKCCEDIVVTMVEIRGDKVRLGFEADPKDVTIHRQEVHDAIYGKKVEPGAA